MNNGDMPAMSISTERNIDYSNGQPDPMFMWLTKREEFASRNMASLLSNLPNWEKLEYFPDDNELARHSINASDALLAELEKPKDLTELEKELLNALLGISNAYEILADDDSDSFWLSNAKEAIAKAKGQL